METQGLTAEATLLTHGSCLGYFHLPSQGSEGQLRPFCEQILKNLKSVMLVEDGAIVLVNDVKCAR